MRSRSCTRNDVTVEIWHPAVGSPRFSFSRDLPERESGREPDVSFVPGSPATSDFDFCAPGEGCDQEPSTADELFSDGKILPIPIQSRNQSVPTTQQAIPPQTPQVPPTEPKQMMACGDDVDEPEKSPPVTQKPSSSFWNFGRSNSLNCGIVGCGNRNGHGHMANFICSMRLLSRSKSTGSSNLDPNPNSRQRHHLRNTTGSPSSALNKQASRTKSNSSTSSAPSLNPSYSRRSYHGGNSGVRFSPVLNVPHSCIPMGGGRGNGLFGLGRLKCGGKEKNGRRKRPLFSPPQPS